MQVTPHGGLANRCTRPLCDLSVATAGEILTWPSLATQGATRCPRAGEDEIRAATIGEPTRVDGPIHPRDVRPGVAARLRARGCRVSARPWAIGSTSWSTLARRPCPVSPRSRSSTSSWPSPTRPTRRPMSRRWRPPATSCGSANRTGSTPAVQGPGRDDQPPRLHGRVARRSTGCSRSATGCGAMTTSGTCTLRDQARAGRPRLGLRPGLRRRQGRGHRGDHRASAERWP